MDSNIDTTYLRQEPLRPELKAVISNIKAKNPYPDFSINSLQQQVPSLVDIVNSNIDDRKSGFETVNYLDVYKPLSSGEGVSMYSTYIPNIDNEERLAQQQTTGEKWANGLQKFGTKTFNAVVGGTVGLVYGIGEAISDQKFSSLYDNDFSNWMNDLDTKNN